VATPAGFEPAAFSLEGAGERGGRRSGVLDTMPFGF
jgi:hypothetical protein